MDSVTQIVLGAAVGYAVSGKTLGKKALILGAVAGTVPDLDYFATMASSDPLLYLRHHRGFSHSLVFSVVGPLGLFQLLKVSRWKSYAKSVGWLFFWGILTHLLLDSFTGWGTQVFWPHPYRVAWNTIFIIDPFYTIPFLICVLIAAFSSKHSVRKKSVIAGLIISSLYLGWSVAAKAVINRKFDDVFKHQHIAVEHYLSRPTIFNTLLWSATAETAEGYYYGFRSILDSDLDEPLYFIPKNKTIPDSFVSDEVDELIYYTKQYYTIEPKEGGIVIHDLRYGFLGDPWETGEIYVFSYELSLGETGAFYVSVKNPRAVEPGKLIGQVIGRLFGLTL